MSIAQLAAKLKKGKEKAKNSTLNNVVELILHTDGLENMRVLNGNKENLKGLYRYIKGKGLKQSIQEMRELEEKDPECNQAPRYKKSDDVAIARITSFN